MPAYVLPLIVIETIVLIILTILLIVKISKSSRLILENQELRTEIEKNEENQREHDDFVAMLVHELRSPVAVMKGAADLMIKDAQKLSREQIETLLIQIRTSSTGLLKIVNDILDVSKIESGKFVLNKSSGSINKLVQEECEYYLASANAKQIQLKYSLEPSVADFSFDPDRIRQVLNNLIDNSIKFTPDQGIVIVNVGYSKDFVQISVSDNGDGINDDLKHKLFHKFVQLNNHQHTKEKGTGLGLVVSKGIVEAHGGKIWIEDNTPKGSKFVFTMPTNQI